MDDRPDTGGATPHCAHTGHDRNPQGVYGYIRLYTALLVGSQLPRLSVTYGYSQIRSVWRWVARADEAGAFSMSSSDEDESDASDLYDD